MAKKKQTNRWLVVAVIIAVLTVLAYLSAGMVSLSIGEDLDGNVALIKIDGIIVTSEDSLFSKTAILSDDIVSFIKAADEDSNIKAILLEINSPGGSAVASKEIADAIKRANKTTMSLIREIGTSGAYWIATSTDYIIANELSITGSIGVVASYLEFNKFFEKYGINYQRLVAGKYKDIGSPLRNLTGEEQKILQKQLDKIHEYFIKEVAKNRNIKVEDVKEISTGEFYLGSDAIQLGLVDELGDRELAIERLRVILNLEQVEFVEYEKPKGFIESLFDTFSDQSYSVGRGIGEGLVSRDKNIVFS